MVLHEPRSGTVEASQHDGSDLRSLGKYQVDSDGFQHRRKRNKVGVGTGGYNKLRTVNKVKRQGIFISRLHEDTTCEDITEYIKDNIGCDILNVDKLKCKHAGYASFHVECAQDQLDALLDESSWDAGILIRKWFPARRNIEQANM